MPGEVVLSQAIIDATEVDTSSLRHRSLALKGKTEPFEAWVWTAGHRDIIPIGDGQRSP